MTSRGFYFVWLTLAFLTLFPSFTTPTIRAEMKEEDDLLGSSLPGIRILLANCLREAIQTETVYNVAVSVIECLKRRVLIALDRVRTMDRLRIGEIELVKNRNLTFINRERNLSSKSWFDNIIEKIDGLFKSHLLKFPIKPNYFFSFSPRRRHHYKDLLPILIFSILAISMIAIPLGFQFLAVLGGKALLLAKLALILTSIQGLKKIATSSINYGLYQVPQQHHNPWSAYDRRLQYELGGDFNHLQSYQQQPDSVVDLFHPLSPRSTSGYDSS
ncbi:uncharacterized protein [Onthophagus taurus]|nr:uncharacterized protein LOC111428105 isoform X2 [Onthophagus taurus]